MYNRYNETWLSSKLDILLIRLVNGWLVGALLIWAAFPTDTGSSSEG